MKTGTSSNSDERQPFLAKNADAGENIELKPAPVDSNKKAVYVRIVFVKIGDIDTPKEQYIAEVYIQARWREPLLDNKPAEELKKPEFNKLWSPALFIENALADVKEISVNQMASLNEKGEAFIAEKRKFRGAFYEALELENFPFDVQDLSITVLSEKPATEVELIPDEINPCSLNVDTFGDKHEWKLYQHVQVTTKSIKFEIADLERQHSAVQATCRAARKAGFFIYNVFIVLLLISSISFSTFIIDCNTAHTRLPMTFTLLLTTVAFKMATNNNLPKISYLTYLDMYVIMGIGYLITLAVWHSTATQLCADKEGYFYKNKIERYVVIGFVCIYLFGLAAFGISIFIRAGGKRKEMRQRDEEFIRLRDEKLAVVLTKTTL